MKKITSIILALAILGCGSFINSSAYAQTAQEGAQWAINQLNKSIDYDKVSGVQCVDLIKAYYAYLGVNPVKGNGKDYATNSLPDGWTRIQYKSGFVPQAGDIAVFDSSTGGGYGHVSIVISATTSNFVSVDQNWSVKAASKVTHTYKGFWGVVRPKFTSNDPVGHIDMVSGGVMTVSGRLWAYDNNKLGASLRIDVYVGGEAGSPNAEGTSFIANNYRPDVDNAYGCGANHGLDFTMTTKKRGTQNVYIYAINEGEGNNVLLGKYTVNIDNPFTPEQIERIKKIFSPVVYASFRDLANAFGDGKSEQSAAKLWQHFLTYALSGLEPSRLTNFSTVYQGQYYLEVNSDVAKSVGNSNYIGALQHFLNHGMGEMRSSHKDFNINVYRNYKDLQAAFGNEWEKYYVHYNQYGQYEKRNAK